MTQASKNGRKPYLFPQKKFVRVFYAINIFNTIYYFKPTNFNARRKIPHFFRPCCLPWFETKNKIRCINAPKYAFTHRNLPESEKYIWIIQNVHEKSRFSCDNWVSCNQTLGCRRLYGDSRVSRAQLMRYCMIGCCFVFLALCFEINVFSLLI